MNIQFLAFAIAVSISPLLSQENSGLGRKYSSSITAEELKSHLEIIASDSFAGREAGSKGQKMAMEYLVNEFSQMGIKAVGDTSYLQAFPLLEQENSGVEIKSGGNVFTMPDDFYLFNRYYKDTVIRSKANFLGYGLAREYDIDDINGKVAVIYSDLSTKDSTAPDLQERVELAKENGAGAVMIVSDDFSGEVEKYSHYISRKRMWLNDKELNHNFPVFYISATTAENIFPELSIKNFLGNENSKRIETQEIQMIFNKPTRKLTSENVLAFIPGSDLSEELLVVTAHYDHIGRNDSVIFNGADDDGTGTAALLEIAEAFMTAIKDGNPPRRSILIMPVSAEEKGLLGSKYYTQNPVFPLENTVANLNIDMIGRVDEKHKNNPNYIYLIGSDRLSQELHEISERVARQNSDIELDYTYNALDDPNRFYYRSDHYNFAKHNIPAIFYFSGVHEDYHKPTDTIDKILFDKVEEISRLIFLTAWEIANRDQRPQLKDDLVE